LIEYNATPEINEINSFAEKLFEKYAMSIIDTDYVFGHCMMFSRKLFDGVGYLDESF
jgi:GT2 family glycosyltransferase